jgi:hypothetical protein
MLDAASFWSSPGQGSAARISRAEATELRGVAIEVLQPS